MKVEIFCCRLPHYYGIGFTPANALRNALAVGGKQDDVDDGKYVMHRLPSQISDVWVDDFGDLNWSFPKGTTADIVATPVTRLFFDETKEEWVEKDKFVVSSPKPKLPKFTVKVKVEGFISIRANNIEEAMDVPVGMTLEDLGAALESSNDFDVNTSKVQS